VIEPPQQLDPQVARSLARFPVELDFTRERIPEMRAALAKLPRPELSNEVERRVEPVEGGLTLRIHRPKDRRGPLPCIYALHPGGFVVGAADGEDARFDDWCPRLGVVGVSVEYRLAPETPYPGPLEDCYAGLCWVVEHAAALDVDPARIALYGASAGGGLAAGLGLLARDRGGPTIACQALAYPMLDDRATTRSSRWDSPLWKPPWNRVGWEAYLGERYGTDDVPAYAAPARATELAGLVPTLLMVGGLDIFFDEDVAFATALVHAGVPVELHVYPGAPHAFDAVSPRSAVTARACQALEAWLLGQLAASGAST
jgi:acetyl esterase/lipase